MVAKKTNPEQDGEYPREDWQYEVANDDTVLGYKEWCEHRKEAECAGGCGGTGIRLNQHGLIEHCDACCKYSNDWQAYMAANPQNHAS